MTGEGSLFDVPPAAIGRFRVLHQVGAGTCGPVFRAVDPDSDAPVAIKLFTLNLPPQRLAGFVEALSDLVATTPPLASAVMPLAAGLHGHTPYFVTSFAQGDSLDVALKQFGPAALPDLIPRVRALAGVLDAAAGRGILHGALHPRDVTISEGDTTLTGLGVWPILAAHGERLPMRRPYRAPELGENAASAAGDQFSLAALAYEWMTGRRAPSAFVAGDMAPVPGADRDALADVFAAALHPDPALRFATCGDFVSGLADLAAGMADDAEAAIAGSRPHRRGKPTAPPSLPLESVVDGATVTTAVGAGVVGPRHLEAFPAEVEGPLTASPSWSETSMATERGMAAAPYSFIDEPAIHPLPEVAQAAPAPGPPVSPPPHLPTVREPLTFGTDDRSALRPGIAVPPTPSGFGVSALIAGMVLGVAIGMGIATFLWGRSGASTPASADRPSTSAPAAEAGPAADPPVAAAPPVSTTPTPPPAGTPASEPAATASPAPAARASVPPPAPPAAAAAGNLLVRTSPAGATVFIDGERRGVTPLTVQKLPLGTRRVRVQRDGFTTEERQVALTRSRPSRSLDLRLTRPALAAAGASPTAAAKTGTLMVESRPAGAAVLLNGQPVGATPVTIGDLAPGSYTVQVQLADFRPISTTVRVVAGERARVAASLTSVQEP